MISGTPPADVLYDESYPFTYRAEDSDGDSAELTFTIVIAAMPSFVDREAGRSSVRGGRCGELRFAGGSWWECGVDVYVGGGIACGSVV